MSNPHHHYKQCETLLGRAQTLLLITGEHIGFKPMEIYQDNEGLYYLYGYDNEAAWIEIAANDIVFTPKGA